MNIVSQITKKCFNKNKYNILTFPTHEPYEVELCKTGHQFYAFGSSEVRQWNHKCRKLPYNYILLNPKKGLNQIPVELEIDIILSHNKAGQFQIAKNFSEQYKIPHINMEHTLPHPSWYPLQLEQWKSLKANKNLFISEYNREQWGWSEKESDYIQHGIDIKFYQPKNLIRHPRILSCVNDWVNRDWCCGYSIWNRITKNLPIRIKGNTPGISTGTSSTEELIEELSSSQIYFNTSTYSPVPMALLEAMSCECAIVTTATCMMPEFIENGINGFISNNENTLREYLEFLLKSPEECRRIGTAARKTIEEKFCLNKFIDKWNLIFKELFMMKV